MSDLPATDTPQCYVVVGPDDQRGPYTLELLIAEVVAGRLNQNTPVWWPGLADWTTMAAHPGVAAEVARRSGAPEPAPMAFAPPVAPPPPQQQTAAPGPSATAAVDVAPSGDVEGGSAGAGTVVEPAYFAGQAPGESTTDDHGAETPTFGLRSDPDEQQGSDVTSEGGTGNGVEAPIEVPAVEVTPSDFMAADEPADEEGFRSAGVGEGLDPVHSDAFAEVVRRSRVRADAASIIQNVDEAVMAGVDSAARAEGFSPTARGESGDVHDLSYVTSDGMSLVVHVGRVRGKDLAGAEGEIPLDASVTSSSYTGELDAGTGRHGEIVVEAHSTGSTASASVGLILGLPDYVDAGYDVDRHALERDLRSVVAVLAHRIGS